MDPVERMNELADCISDAALAAMRKARADLMAGTLSGQEFNVVTRQFNETMELATRITAAAIHAAATELESLTAAVQESKERIEGAIDRIAHASNAVKIIAGILAFAASIVAAVATPALLPGAVAAGANLAMTLQDVSRSEIE